MKKFANYMILPEFQLILECCKGEASVQDAIKMKRSELADDLYDPGYNIIVDFQEFETFLDSTITDSITKFFDFLKEIDLKSKVAFITAEPHQVVISMILKELGDNKAIKIESFSTIGAAVKYLGIPVEKTDLIEKKLMELNKNTR